jgi:hypothetical protein
MSWGKLLSLHYAPEHNVDEFRWLNNKNRYCYVTPVMALRH